MNTKTDIVNYGLSQLGEGFSISDFDNDPSEEARAARDIYQMLWDDKMREFRWTWAETRGSLALVQENPTPSYRYAYRYPTNCLDFIRIDNGDRSETRLPQVVFTTAHDNAGKLIYTDYPEAVGVWTEIDLPIRLWPSDFKTAFSIELAAMMAPRIMMESGEAKQNKLFQLANIKWRWAKANNNREQVLDPKPVSRIQRSRGSVGRSTFSDRPLP